MVMICALVKIVKSAGLMRAAQARAAWLNPGMKALALRTTISPLPRGHLGLLPKRVSWQIVGATRWVALDQDGGGAKTGDPPDRPYKSPLTRRGYAPPSPARGEGGCNTRRGKNGEGAVCYAPTEEGAGGQKEGRFTNRPYTKRFIRLKRGRL
jgi:hypothetical protein